MGLCTAELLAGCLTLWLEEDVVAKGKMVGVGRVEHVESRCAPQLDANTCQ